MDKFKKGFYWDDDPNPGGAQDPPPDPDPGKGSDPPPEPQKDKDPEPVPYSRFKEVNESYTKLKDEHDKMLQAQEDAKKKKLEEDEKWKDLYEQEQEKNKKSELENLRLRVAQKKGLPPDLVDRLHGETEQELEADADKLLAFVDTSKSPGLPAHGGKGQATTFDVNNMTPEEIRKNSGKILEQARTGTG